MDETLVDRVAEIITRYNMLTPGSHIGAAVSGGADSVVLLQILGRLAPQFRIQLVVLHLNHQLRGTESDGDEEFVRALAASLGWPCITERTQLGPGNLEQTARDARREFFRRVRVEQGLGSVALGHTRTDQAETVFFRFLRGSGTAGLSGMRFTTSDGLIRPLLTIGRREVREWAVAERISWREDSMNGDLRFARNRLRNETMPSLAEAFNPNLEGVLAGTANIAQAEENYWDLQISTIYRQITKRTQLGSFLQITDLDRLHLAEQRRLIRHCLHEIKGDLRSIDASHVDAILRVCASVHGHDRVIVPGVDALRSFGTLLLTVPGRLNADKRYYKADLEVGKRTDLPYGLGAITLKLENSGDEFCANFKSEEYQPIETAILNGDALSGGAFDAALYVRNWEPGDELQRAGHHGRDKVKALFQEFRVFLWERRHWPVVMCGDDVVWVRRFGCAAGFEAASGCRNRLRLTYTEALGNQRPEASV